MTPTRDETTPATAGLNGTHPPAPPAEVEVGTPEWDRLTRRRAELIHKKNRGGLTDAERAEYEQLHQTSRATLARTFPRPRLTPEQRAVLGLDAAPSDEAAGK